MNRLESQSCHGPYASTAALRLASQAIDYMFRADALRWQHSMPSSLHVRIEEARESCTTNKQAP